MPRMSASPFALPRPLVAGVGLVVSLPGTVAAMPGRLPGLALHTVGQLRQRYDRFARVGAAALGQAESPSAPAWPGADADLADATLTDLATLAGGLWPDEPVRGGGEGDLPGDGAALDGDTAASARSVSAAAADRVRSHPAPPAVQDLAVADFDHLSLPQLRGRLAKLTEPQLTDLRDYESAHGNRLPVLTMLENRIAKLAPRQASAPAPGGAP